MAAGNYTWLTVTTAVQQLAQRLNDPNNNFWSAAELQIYISQSLRQYNVLCNVWRQDFQFNSTSLWNSLGSLSGSPRQRTLTDTYCYTELEYMLLEPASGGTWTGTNQFNISSLSQALQRRRDDMIQVSNCNQTLLANIPLTPNTTRTYLPDNTIDVERVRYLPLSGGPEYSNSATIPVGHFPEGTAVNQNTNLVYVGNNNDNTISVINGATNTVIHTISVGNTPLCVAVNPVTNMVYAGNIGDSTVSVINGATNIVVDTISGINTPTCIAVNSVTNNIYVGTSDSVTVISGATNAVVSTISTGSSSEGIAVNANTNTIYANQTGSSYGSILVISGATNTITNTFNIASNDLIGMSVNPATNMVYAVDANGNLLYVINGGLDAIVTTVPVGNYSYAVAVNSATNTIYVANNLSNTVSVISGTTNTVTNTIPVGDGPYGLAVNESTNTVYVANTRGDTVTVIGVTIVPPTGGPGTTLYRDDTVAQEFYEAPLYQQQSGTPQTFSLSSEPPLSWDVDIPPNQEGTYEAVVLQSGAPFNPPTPTLLGIPDDFAWALQFGALADLLGQESEATDRERAEYAMKRYQDGLQLMLKSPWIELGKVNGQAVSVDSIISLDRYEPGWDSNPSTFGPVIVAGGMDFIAAPISSGIGVTVLANAPITATVGGVAYLQVSRSDWDAILFLAQSRACFKMGGGEWKQALELEKQAIQACAEENSRIRSMGAFSDILIQRGQVQEREMNRYNSKQKS